MVWNCDVVVPITTPGYQNWLTRDRKFNMKINTEIDVNAKEAIFPDFVAGETKMRREYQNDPKNPYCCVIMRLKTIIKNRVYKKINQLRLRT